MKSSEIRSTFLDYFRSKGHAVVPSSSLVPQNDPTLLFVNSGMVQFKDVFLGIDKRSYVRATTAQRCVRAGGKHTEVENVGYTARHHTFFEMLGNFSFGDYFKRDAIHYAWELLTRQYGLPPERLWTTVYIDDNEAYDIWTKDIGVPPERCVRIGDNLGGKFASDNFWQMADTGPCGPCSEIFYDHGPGVFGGPPGSPDEDGDRYVEIWNLVFMQYNRDASGTMTPLPKPCVDTGMGLERVAAVLQGVVSNYDTDLFTPLIASAEKLCSSTLTTRPDLAASFRIIADHSRAATFLVSDGVVPSNEGRGYVLRKIIRRALRHSRILGAPSPFLSKMSDAVRTLMASAYPELAKTAERDNHILDEEETRFSRTVNIGLKKLEEDLNELRGPVLIEHHAREQLRGTPFTVGQYAGDKAFRLYDTYGLPRDF